ncbi:baseplate J/gp47 family protein [Mycobacteroides abscessus]|uniref:baseplate J/gp47 family protein n=1 Tax=unclassified Desemzia TaxID=2685243 RepID=UPI001A99C8B3
MVYEHIEYETLLERMMERVPDSFDKRESSVIYNALAPAAVELQLMYMEFDIILQETFGDTASRDYLIRRVAERGITPYSATYAVVKGEFTPIDLNVPVGSRFSIGDLNYTVTSKITNGQYQLQCEMIGSVGNELSGTLIPIDYIDGLETAVLSEILVPGEDEEDTELIRERYFQTFDTKPFGGNKKDYIQKTNAIPGVGSTKVTPVWNGGGTVKLTILNSDFDSASNTLIQNVQKEIDPTKLSDGLGIAPIGHIVTVDTVTNVNINVVLSLTFDDGYSLQTLETTIGEVLERYLMELRRDWANQPYTIIRTAQIDTRILAISGVIDIENTRINGKNKNLELLPYEIPILGGVSND